MTFARKVGATVSATAAAATATAIFLLSSCLPKFAIAFSPTTTTTTNHHQYCLFTTKNKNTIGRSCKNFLTLQQQQQQQLQGSLSSFAPKTVLFSKQQILSGFATTATTTSTTTTTRLYSSSYDNNNDDDDFYEGYEDFVANLDFNDDETPQFSSWDDGRGRGGRGGRGRDDGGRGRGGREDGSRGRGGRGGRGHGGDYHRGGHDYTRAPTDDPNDGNVDVGVVDQLIAQRLSYRKRGEFDKADAIRDELTDVHGVTIWDRDRMWTTDPRNARKGSRGGRGGGGRERGGGGGGGNFDSSRRYDNFNNNADEFYDNAGGGGGRDWSPRGRDRGRDYGYGDDNPRRGRGRGGDRRGGRQGRRRERDFGPNGHDYEQTGGPISPDCGLEEDEIHRLIAERLQHKLNRQYDEADDIEAQLESQGVEVHDGFKLWRADGKMSIQRGDLSPDRQRGLSSRGGNPRVRRYTRLGGYDLEDDEVEEIESLVARRAEAKAERNYDEADEIRKDLFKSYGVAVDDGRFEWSIQTEAYRQSETSEPLEVVQDEEKVRLDIEEKLAMRVAHRLNKDFDEADAIRNELEDEYSVVIDDRQKTWRVVPGVGRKWREVSPSPQDYAATFAAADEEASSVDKAFDSLFGDDDDDNDDEGAEEEDEDSISSELEEGLEEELEEELEASLEEEIEAELEEELEEELDAELDEEIEANMEEELEEEFEETIKDLASDNDDDDDVVDDDDDSFTTGTSTSNSYEDLNSLTVPMLKEKLREAGLPVGGRKAELIERLMMMGGKKNE